VKIIKHIDFEYARVQLLEIGIIRIEMLNGHIIDLEESVQINIAEGELLGGKLASGLVLMVAENTAQFTNAAREFSASKEGLRFSIAEALVVKNLAQRIIVNFYIKINNPSVPNKAFDNEDEAIEWLLSYK
jgi:hypothetical protein